MTRENIDARLARIKERFDTGLISMTDLLWLIDKVHAGTPKGMVRITTRAPRVLKLVPPVSGSMELRPVRKVPMIDPIGDPPDIEARRKRWREAAARRKEKVKRSTKS